MHQAAALGWIPASPRGAWCPTSNLLALETGASPGDAAVFILEPGYPKVRFPMLMSALNDRCQADAAHSLYELGNLMEAVHPA